MPLPLVTLMGIYFGSLLTGEGEKNATLKVIAFT